MAANKPIPLDDFKSLVREMMKARDATYLDALFETFGENFKQPLRLPVIYMSVERIFRKHGRPMPENFEAAIRAELQNYPMHFKNVGAGLWQRIELVPPPGL